jgi:hypothetical protein
MRKVLSKVQKVRAITAFQQKYEASLEKVDKLANRIYKAFENPKAKFTKEQIAKVAATLDSAANHVAKGATTCFTNLKVAIASEIPTDRVVAHIEDAHTLLSKIAILRSQAIASIASDEDISIDESGQLVDEPMEESEDMENEEMMDEEISDEEKTPEELQEDIHEDLDMLVEKLQEEVGEEVAEPKEASRKAKKQCGESNPDMPKENPASKEVSDVKKLQSEYEKEPTMKNAKKKSADTQAADAELNPDMPKENPGMQEESLEELVDDYEASPSDPENLEMEDSMIDDAVNMEILTDNDVDQLEDEMVTSSTATLRERKLASSKRTASNNPASEDDVMKDIISSMF